MLSFKKKPKDKVKENKTTKKSTKPKKVSSKVTEVLHFLDINDDHIVLKDGILDILQLEGKDILSLNTSDKERAINIFHVFYKTLAADIKIITLNFPVDTSIQKEYIDYKMRKTDNEIYQSFLSDKKKELEFLEKSRTNKEYYLFIFAANTDVLKTVRTNIKRTIANIHSIKQLSNEKKKCILFKLNNKNVKIETRGDFID
ncbi:MAG: hypothetical protein PHX70_13720 [Clostridium sp.]|nr:hypothetical protein [Clostridium sp.]